MPTKKKKGNGEGTVYKVPNGYRGQIVVGTDKDGKPIRRSVTAPTAKEVNDQLTRIKHSILIGDYVLPSEVTVCELARGIMKEERNLNYIREGTYYRHIETIKRIEKNPCMKNTPIQQLTPAHIKQYLQYETRMSQSIINKIYLMLNKTMKEAVKRNVLSQNPMEDVKKPKSSQQIVKVRALTTEEEIKLYKILTTEDIRYSHQMLLSMFTGMRMGEVNALSPQDINMKTKTISVDKTMSRTDKGEAFVSQTTKTEAGKRIIPISDTVLPLITEILECRANDDVVFMSKRKLVTTQQVNMQFQRTIEKYDILDPTVKGKVSLHSLRHTFATRCIEAGMQPKVLQHLLGHTDITVTLNTYCDAFESFQKENIAKADEYMQSLGIKYDFDPVGKLKEA